MQVKLSVEPRSLAAWMTSCAASCSTAAIPRRGSCFWPNQQRSIKLTGEAWHESACLFVCLFVCSIANLWRFPHLQTYPWGHGKRVSPGQSSKGPRPDPLHVDLPEHPTHHPWGRLDWPRSNDLSNPIQNIYNVIGIARMVNKLFWPTFWDAKSLGGCNQFPTLSLNGRSTACSFREKKTLKRVAKTKAGTWNDMIFRHFEFLTIPATSWSAHWRPYPQPWTLAKTTKTGCGASVLKATLLWRDMFFNLYLHLFDWILPVLIQ